MTSYVYPNTGDGYYGFGPGVGELRPGSTLGGLTCEHLKSDTFGGATFPVTGRFTGNQVSAITGKSLWINGVEYSIDGTPTFDGTGTVAEWTVPGFDFNPNQIYGVDLGDTYGGPVVGGYSTVNFSTSTFNISWTNSGRVAGDLLILEVGTANEPISEPSGFTEFTDFTGTPYRGTAAAAGGVRIQLFVKVSNGSEGSLGIGDGGNVQHARGFVIKGRAGQTVEIAAAVAGNGTGTSCSFTSPTTTDDDNLIVYAVATDRDAGSSDNFTNFANAALVDPAEIHDTGTSSGAGVGTAFFAGQKLTAGSVGNATATQATNVGYAWIALAIRHVSTGGSTEYSSAALSGAGSASAASRRVARASTAVSGAGTASAPARRLTYASVALSASGALTAQAGRYTAASASLSANGTAAINARLARTAAASLSAGASASASVRAQRVSAASLNGSGSTQANAHRVMTAAAALSASGSVSAPARRTLFANLAGAGQGTASVSANVVKASSASLGSAGSLTVSTRARLNASASLTGVGSLTASVQGGGAASVSLAGAGMMSVAARVERRAVTALSAAGSVQAIGRRLTPASVTLAAQGALSATIGADNEVVAVSLAGSGTLTVSCRVERRAAAVLTGAGAMAVLARIEARSSAALSGAGVLTTRAIIPSGLPPSEARTVATAMPARTANSNESARDISTARASRNQVTAVGSRDAQSVRSAR